MNIQNFIASVEQRKQLTPDASATSLLAYPPKAEAVYAFLPRCLVRESMTFDECYDYLQSVWNSIPICMVTSEMIGTDINVQFSNGATHAVPISDIAHFRNGHLFLIDSLGAYVRRESSNQEERQCIFIFVDNILALAGQKDYDSVFMYVVIQEMTRAMLDSDVNTNDLMYSANYRLFTFDPLHFEVHEEPLTYSLAMVLFSIIRNICLSDSYKLINNIVPQSRCFVHELNKRVQELIQRSQNWSLNKKWYSHCEDAYLNLTEGLEPSLGYESSYRLRKFALKPLTSFVFPKCDVIESNLLIGFSGITSLDIPEGVTDIMSDVIVGCPSLLSITFPSTLIYIEPEAIISCPNLRHLSVHPDNEYYYSKDNCVFDRRDNRLVLGCLTSIIPEGTKVIAHGAFCGCEKLKALVLPESLETIGIRAFSETGIESIVIPANVESIQREAFSGCRNLKNVIFKGSPALSFLSFSHCGYNVAFTSKSEEQIIADTSAFLFTGNSNSFNFPGGMRKIRNIGIEDREFDEMKDC